MILYRISHGLWDVYAICDAGGRCEVLEDLLDLKAGNRQQAGMAMKMLNLLQDWVPHQPQGPRTHNTNISKHLSGNVFEFKRGQKKGPKIRVLYFYGNRKEVICTKCFLKGQRMVPKSFIDDAESMRNRFLKDHAAGKIQKIGV